MSGSVVECRMCGANVPRRRTYQFNQELSTQVRTKKKDKYARYGMYMDIYILKSCVMTPVHQSSSAHSGTCVENMKYELPLYASF